MKKALITMTVLTTLLFSALAGPYNDVSLTVGHQAGLRNLQGLNITYGVNVGLTRQEHRHFCSWKCNKHVRQRRTDA